MNKTFCTTLALIFGLLSANVALANEAVLGALLGGGAGAAVGSSIHGRNGAIVGGALGAAAGAAIGAEQNRYRQPLGYYSPPPVYYVEPAYYPPPVYYAPPVRIVQPSVYYIQGGYDRSHRGYRHDRRDWDRHDNGHGYGGHRY